MATPIQYTPQYIPTDLGVMQGMLDKRQQEYDAGFAAPLMFEDQFAQIEVSPENIAGKQAVLGNFQSRVQEIVDRYGGDYGAASRDIARAIAKERQNPFYQMAPQHAEALKRQQMLTDKYGANAMVLNEVPRTFVDEQGRVQDVNLTPTVLNQMDLERALATEFGHLGKQTRESRLRNVTGRKGMLEAITTRGITQDEVSGVSQQMMERLYNMNPDLAKAIDAGDPRAMQIAENMANQLVGGYDRQFVKDPSYDVGAGQGGFSGGMPPLTPTAALGVKSDDVPNELKNTRKASKIDESSNPMAQAWKENFDKSIITEETLVKEGILSTMNNRSIISKNSDGTIDSKGTLDNINKAIEVSDISNIKYNLNSLMSPTNSWRDEGERSFNRKKLENMTPEELSNEGIPEDWATRYADYSNSNMVLIPSAKKEAKVAEQKERINEVKRLGRFKDYYKLSLGNALESENSDLGVNFYDFDLAGTDKTLDPRMKNLYSELQIQFDRMNADSFDFLTSPKDSEVLVDGREKKQDKFKRKHGLRKKGALNIVGIGSTPYTGVVFRVEDNNGEEYTVRPKDPNVTTNLISHFGGGGQNDVINQFRAAEDDYTIKNTFNNQYSELKNKYGTYRDFINAEVTSEYEALRFLQALKSRGLSMDDSIQLFK